MAEQTSNIFRKKTLDRISSPEQLTDYLRVTNPGIWMVLATVILLLAGIFAWSTAGRLETLASGTAVVRDGTAEIILADSGSVQSGMAVRLGGEEYLISTVEADDYGRAVAWAPVRLPDGKYDVQVVLESVHPIQFLFD
ncbi:MAG: hypothetical protein IJ705_05480 [Oscillospiraceae bacterium]|nr:hypothetical protein [Oscillospiraceae bacterium]